MNKSILCWIFGHKYFVVQSFRHTSRKVGCKRCYKRWGMNDHVKAFIPWDGELDEMYVSHGYRLIEDILPYYG